MKFEYNGISCINGVTDEMILADNGINEVKVVSKHVNKIVRYNMKGKRY